MLTDKIRGFLWRLVLILRGARVGRNFSVHGSLDILLREGASLAQLTIGDNVSLGGKIYIRMRDKGRITLKDRVKTGTEIWLVVAHEAELMVGENTALSSYSIFNGGHGLTIGTDCLFAAFVYVNSSEHLHAKGIPIQKQGYVGAPVDIGDDVWLGGHVIVNQGVKIGSGAIIGGGAVVTKNIPAHTIAVGVPARVMKERV